MEIQESFKQTEIGIIPIDWDLFSYGEIFDFLITATYSRSQLNGDGEISPEGANANIAALLTIPPTTPAITPAIKPFFID